MKIHSGSASVMGSVIGSPDTNSRQQRQNIAGDTTNRSAPAAGVADIVTISQAGRARAAQATTQATGRASYDFTHMTPQQMWDVSQELYDSGKIDSRQRLMLASAGLVFGSIGKNGQFIPPTDAEIAGANNTPMNYLQYIQDRMEFLESTGDTVNPQHGYAAWKDLLSTLGDMNSGAVA